MTHSPIDPQRKLSLLLQNSPLAVIEWDENFAIVEWNGAAERIFGYAKSEVLGCTADLIVPPAAREQVRHVMAELLAVEGGIHSINENITKDGRIILCEWHNTLMLAADGQVVGVISMAQDVTERDRLFQQKATTERALQRANQHLELKTQKLKETIKTLQQVVQEREQIADQLRQSRNFLQLVIDSIPQRIFWKDQNSVYLGCNRYLAEAVGLTHPKEIIGKTDYDLAIPQEEAELYRQVDAQVMASGEPEIHRLWTITQANGRKKWIDANKIPLYDTAGNCVGILGTYEDISDRKRAEIALEVALEQSEHQSNLLRGVIDSSLDWIFVKDQNMRYILVSQSFAQGLGQPIQEILGKTDLELGVSEADVFGDAATGRIGFQTSDQAVLQGKIMRITNDSAFVADGTRHYFDTQKIPLRMGNGEIFGILGVCRDITERRQSEEKLRTSQEFLNAIVDAIPDPLFVKDERHRWVLLNRASCDMIGRDRSELLGKSDYDISPKAEADVFWAEDDLVLTTRQARVNEEYYTDVNGHLRFISTKKTFFEDAEGQQFIVGTIRDMTQRKQVEEALRRSEARFQRLVANVPGMIYQFKLVPGSTTDPVTPNKFEMPYASSYSQEIFEVAPELIQANPCLILNQVYPEDAQSFEDSVATSAQTLQPWHWSGRHITPSGQFKWIEGFARPELQVDGSIVWDGVLIDVTARKRAEEHLLRISKAVESTSDAIGLADIDGRSSYHNPAFEQLFGYSVAALNAVGGPAAIYVHDQEFQNVFTTIHSGYSWRGEVTVQARNGRIFPVELRADVIRDQSGNVIGLLGTHTDISDRKRIETERQQAAELMRQSEAELRQKAEELEYALKHLQLAQAQLIQSEKMSSLGQLVAGVAHEINNPVSFIYGNLFHANRYVQDIISLLDLYQRHYAKPELDIQKKIKAIDLPFLCKDLPKLLASMQMGADRIQEIVQSLRNFSRKDESEHKTVDIHEGLESTLLILRNRLKEQADRPEIEVIKLYGDIPLVECYPGALNQVLMNILTNAIDAIEEELLTHPGTKSAPTIRIKTELRQLKERQARNQLPTTQPSTLPTTGIPASETQASEIPASESSASVVRASAMAGAAIQPPVPKFHLSIRIADNGPGIPEAIKQRIFDPFFTTKPVGKGTGMGMSISYQLITETHNGSLRCLSTVGEGTEFIIEIPVELP